MVYRLQKVYTPEVKCDIAPERWCLEDYFPIGKVTFRGYGKLREGSSKIKQNPWEAADPGLDLCAGSCGYSRTSRWVLVAKKGDKWQRHNVPRIAMVVWMGLRSTWKDACVFLLPGSRWIDWECGLSVWDFGTWMFGTVHSQDSQDNRSVCFTLKLIFL